MQFQYVISIEQQSAAEIRAEAQAAAAEARAEAQAEAARVRVEAQQIREQTREIREQVERQIREQVQHQIQIGQRPGGEGVILVPPPVRHNDIPPHVMEVITIFVVAAVICIVGLPIARALGRWIDRRGLPSPVNAELAAQMNRIEQAVDTMSVEVERISEAQRFQAKLLSDREQVRA